MHREAVLVKKNHQAQAPIKATVPVKGKPIFSSPLGLLKQARLNDTKPHYHGLGCANFFQRHGLRRASIEPGGSAASNNGFRGPRGAQNLPQSGVNSKNPLRPAGLKQATYRFEV
jgi:hypothetical protein